MKTSLTIVRYPAWAIPFAFLGMAWMRIPLYLNKKISFFKLMGSGKNGTFDKTPDLRQWAIMCVFDERNFNGMEIAHKPVYGKSIARWLKWFGCEIYSLSLDPVEGHGLWDGTQPFGDLKKKADHEGMIAVLTRATIRFSRLSYFWKHVAPVAAQMSKAEGFITSVGIGEIPWIKQATFSIWESREAMKAFAYKNREHAEVIKKTREQRWYSEDMFIRFRITHCTGTLRGSNPLEGKL